MRLLFVVDGRSPIARNWMAHFMQGGYEVHLATTFPCPPDPRLASQLLVPVAFSGAAAGSEARSAGGTPPGGARAIRLRALLRHWLGPFTLPAAARRLGRVIRQVQPDLVHAMRVPYEGMLAAEALAGGPSVPLLVSIWGNDFTLHAPSSPPMARYTRRAMQRADALHADCQRDLRLAGEWGLPADRPTLLAPGSGGIRREIFHPGDPLEGLDASQLRSVLDEIPPRAPVVVNPRGFRAYVRNDTFFRSIPLILNEQPETRFLCPLMAGEAEALRWKERLGLGEEVLLLPRLDPRQMASLYRRAWVSVSPSTHDGTPNTLLEAMACGAFPVAGDLESIREWIEDGLNGLLVDPADPAALARAVRRALAEEGLRRRAAEHNLRLVTQRAAYDVVMPQVEAFYHLVHQRSANS